MTDIVLNMFFFVSKIVGNTNIIPLQIVILLTSTICIFVTGYLLKGLCRTSNEKIYLLKGLSPLIFISFFFILVFTVIPLPYMNDYPSNITYKIKETNDSLSERAVNNYVATIKYGLHKENIDVVKVNKKYNKPDNVKDKVSSDQDKEKLENILN